MSDEQKTGFESIEAKNEETFYRSVCEEIAKLSPLKYATLRTWLMMQPTVLDWQRLMSS